MEPIQRTNQGKQRGSNLLRAAVAGFSILVSVPVILHVIKDKPVPVAQKAEASVHTIHYDAVVSPDKDTSMANLEKLARLVAEGKADKWLLSNVAANSIHPSTRLAALAKIADNEDALFSAYNASEYAEARSQICERLAGIADTLKQSDSRIVVAFFSQNRKARLIALNGLNDKVDRVMDVAQQSWYVDTRMAAFGLLMQKVADHHGNKQVLASVREALEHIVRWTTFPDSKNTATHLLNGLPAA